MWIWISHKIRLAIFWRLIPLIVPCVPLKIRFFDRWGWFCSFWFKDCFAIANHFVLLFVCLFVSILNSLKRELLPPKQLERLAIEHYEYSPKLRHQIHIQLIAPCRLLPKSQYQDWFGLQYRLLLKQSVS